MLSRTWIVLCDFADILPFISQSISLPVAPQFRWAERLDAPAVTQRDNNVWLGGFRHHRSPFGGPRALQENHFMATKEDQEILRLLVQHVSRAFYESKYTIIMDQLARHPV